MASSEQNFEIKDGSVVVEAKPAVPTGSKGIERIYEMISDPDVAIADISRLIALEIVNVMKKMAPEDPLDRGVTSQRDLNDQVKAYRELQRTLTESDQLSKKDVLNIEGEKFKFVFSELIRYFRKSMEDGGIDDVLASNIMLQFGDLVRANEGTLRTELNKIGTGR